MHSCSDNDLTEDELEAAKSIYSTIGVVEMIPEHLLDAACGLSGGGPAYVAMFIEAMADGGVNRDSRVQPHTALQHRPALVLQR